MITLLDDNFLPGRIMRFPFTKEYIMTTFPIPEKRDLIKKCVAGIEKMKQVIKATHDDQTMTNAERAAKIARCNEIISNYMFTISRAQEYLDACARQQHNTHEMLGKTK